MTSSSKSKQSEGLSRGDSNVVDAPFVEVNKRKEEKKESTTTTTTTSTGWPWGGSKTTTVVKEKTPQQKVAEMGNDLLKDALEEVEMEIKLEKQKQKVMPSNWSIFDLHEEQLVKEENQKMEKKKPKKPKKPNRTKDTFKVALLEGVIFSGKAIVEMICLSKFDKSPQGENKTEKKEHTFRY
jgi:hypothetical protein